jgi:hypothetical protein
MHQQPKLHEGLEPGDLKRQIHDEVHIDEFKSKLGDDSDVCVFSFKVAAKEPALDLVSFIEKGYDWVLDADVSSGEMEDGSYVVFVELHRTPEVPNQLIELLGDLKNVTNRPGDRYRVCYHKDKTEHKPEVDTLLELIPVTSDQYKAKFGDPDAHDSDLDSLRNAAGVKVKTKAPKNAHTESIRALAGII